MLKPANLFQPALERHPNGCLVRHILLSLNRAVGGVLDAVLLRLSDTLEKQQEFSSKVGGALIYPIIVTVGMIIVVFMYDDFCCAALIITLRRFQC